MLVGPKGENGSESFDIEVCSLQWTPNRDTGRPTLSPTRQGRDPAWDAPPLITLGQQPNISIGCWEPPSKLTQTPIAGLTALSEYTDLAKGPQPIYAIDNGRRKAFEKKYPLLLTILVGTLQS